MFLDVLDLSTPLQEKWCGHLPCRHHAPARRLPGREPCKTRDHLSPHWSTTNRVRRQRPPRSRAHHPDVCLHADRLAAGKNQTVRRARPLARRRAMTFRPFLVLMRFRNPCSRLRLRFEGCLKVNDIAHSFPRNQLAMKRPHYRGETGGCQSIGSLLASTARARTPHRGNDHRTIQTKRTVATPWEVLEALLPSPDKDATAVSALSVRSFSPNSLTHNTKAQHVSTPHLWHPHCVIFCGTNPHERSAPASQA